MRKTIATHTQEPRDKTLGTSLIKLGIHRGYSSGGQKSQIVHLPTMERSYRHPEPFWDRPEGRFRFVLRVFDVKYALGTRQTPRVWMGQPPPPGSSFSTRFYERPGEAFFPRSFVMVLYAAVVVALPQHTAKATLA